MSAKAQILRDSKGNITVQMQGNLGHEYGLGIKKELVKLADENPACKITVDLGGLSFVGSSGICHFIETIDQMSKDARYENRIGLTNVSGEFKRVFRLFSMEEANIIWDEQEEVEADVTPTAPKKHLFEN